jgi:hypothetical protein
VWFHPEFMLRHLPKVIDKKLIDQMRSFRQQYLTQRSGQDLARYVCIAILKQQFHKFEEWMLNLRSACNNIIVNFMLLGV